MDHVAQEVAVQKRKETKATFEILTAVGVGTLYSAVLEPAQALTCTARH